MNTAAKSTNKTINLKVYITAHYYEDKKEFIFQAWSYDPTPYNKEYVLIGSQNIEVVVPSYETILPKYIDGLKQTQADIRAKMVHEIEIVQERINRCLALEYVPLDNITDPA